MYVRDSVPSCLKSPMVKCSGERSDHGVITSQVRSGRFVKSVAMLSRAVSGIDGS